MFGCLATQLDRGLGFQGSGTLEPDVSPNPVPELQHPNLLWLCRDCLRLRMLMKVNMFLQAQRCFRGFVRLGKREFDVVEA